MNHLEKLKAYFPEQGITQEMLANEIGTTQQYISAILNGRKGVGKKMAEKFKEKYKIQPSWMLTGEGDMLGKENAPHYEAQPYDINLFVKVPMITIPAQAGYLRGYGDEEYVEALPTIPVIADKNFRGKYRIFEVKGDSMDNDSRLALCEGDKVLAREVKKELWFNKLHIKDWYFVIVHRSEGVLVKQIIEHNTQLGTITYHSLNPLYEDATVHLNDVLELYNVIKVVDRNVRF